MLRRAKVRLVPRPAIHTLKRTQRCQVTLDVRFVVLELGVHTSGSIEPTAPLGFGLVAGRAGVLAS